MCKKKSVSYRLLALIMCLSMLLSINAGTAFAVDGKQVVLVGDLQSQFLEDGKHGNGWDPGSTATAMTSLGNGFYTFTGTLPGTITGYNYKVALGGGWAENYGVGGISGGANVFLDVKEKTTVSFYYNDNTHKMIDSTKYNFISEDKLPKAVIDNQDLLLRDPDFSNLYSASSDLKKGSHTYDIKFDGKTISSGTLTLTEDKKVTFYYDVDSKAALVDDGSIDDSKLLHDTFDLNFRAPFEAIKTGEKITLSIRGRKGDIKNAKLLVSQAKTVQVGAEYITQYGAPTATYDMKYSKTVNIKDVGDVDYWTVTVSFKDASLYGYKFKINDLKEYGDDSKQGAVGTVGIKGISYYQLTVYDANFKTPDWMKSGIVYQIFPDRFYNGDTKNDKAVSTTRGSEPVQYRKWNEIPANASNTLDGDTYNCNDFFGGDLQGIIKKLDYLKGLGVTVIYVNPIMQAASNHKYDTISYEKIDPRFGTEKDFIQLTKEMEKRGMHLVMDGVFNHTGDDSIYFDRYGKYDTVGAYEYWSKTYDIMNKEGLSQEKAEQKAKTQLIAAGQKFSPYNFQNWFKVNNVKVADDVNPANKRYEYTGWSGTFSLVAFNEILPSAVTNPAVADHKSELNNTDWANYFLFNKNSIAKQWFTKGLSGWRMDVANEIDYNFWKSLRTELKKTKTSTGDEPLILGESYNDASKFFTGDQFDSVTNYPFRRAINDTFLLGGKAEDADVILKTLRQNYPKEAFYSLMNLLDSHDTPRAIYTLGSGANDSNTAEKAGSFNYDLGKIRLKLAVMFQMGYPGAPMIYYGDEAGQFGAGDPDTRRTYPWGQEDKDLLKFYKDVTKVRTDNKDLFTKGDLFTLYAQGDVYVYARKQGNKYAIVALNRGDSKQTLSLDLNNKIKDNIVFNDQLLKSYKTTTKDGKVDIVIPAMTGRMLISK